MLLTCFSFHYNPDKDHDENVLRKEARKHVAGD